MALLVAKAGLPAPDRTDDPHKTFADVGLDSLAFLQLQAELQAATASSCPTTGPQSYTFGEIVADVNERLAPHRGECRMSAPTVGHVDNSVLIDADLDLVWDVTNDVEHWPELFTEYASAEILERDGDTVRFRLTMHPDENGTAWSWVSERTLDRAAAAGGGAPGRARAVRVHGHRWTYTAEGDGTRMRWIQDFRMRPDAPVDTAAMTDRINTNTAIQMDVIRHKVERLAASRRRWLIRMPTTCDIAGETMTATTDNHTGLPSGPSRSTTCRPTGGAAATSARSCRRPPSAPPPASSAPLRLEPGEVVTEHWHPYSEEFLFCVQGDVTLRLNGEERRLRRERGRARPDRGAAPADERRRRPPRSSSSSSARWRRRRSWATSTPSRCPAEARRMTGERPPHRGDRRRGGRARRRQPAGVLAAAHRRADGDPADHASSTRPSSARRSRPSATSTRSRPG